MAVALASFNISTDSISDGLRSASGLDATWLPRPVRIRLVLLINTPSTIYSGSLLALIELVPRTRIKIPPPGTPELDVTCTPADLPCNNWSGLAAGMVLMSLKDTVVCDPVNVLRDCSP